MTLLGSDDGADEGSADGMLLGVILVYDVGITLGSED